MYCVQLSSPSHLEFSTEIDDFLLKKFDLSINSTFTTIWSSAKRILFFLRLKIQLTLIFTKKPLFKARINRAKVFMKSNLIFHDFVWYTLKIFYLNARHCLWKTSTKLLASATYRNWEVDHRLSKIKPLFSSWLLEISRKINNGVQIQ